MHRDDDAGAATQRLTAVLLGGRRGDQGGWSGAAGDPVPTGTGADRADLGAVDPEGPRGDGVNGFRAVGWVPAGPELEQERKRPDGGDGPGWFDSWEPERAWTAKGGAVALSWPARCRASLADRLPFGWGTAGHSVPPKAAIAGLVLALAVSAGVLARAATARPDTRLVAPSTRSTAPTASSAGNATTRATGTPAPSGVPAGTPALAGTGQVVVDVVGRVRRRGLVRLPAGARVADAISAAGGASSGAALDRINLARVLGDGEQVLVPGPNDPLPAGAGAGAGAGTGAAAGGTGSSGSAGGAGAGRAGAGGVIDLNTASESQLDALPGIGPVLAGRITAWRAAHGRFSSVDELGEVSGIGPKLLERLRSLVRV